MDDAPIPLSSLRRWQPQDHDDDASSLAASLAHPPTSSALPNAAPFACDPQLNARVVLWHGPIWRLAVDAVVNSTNEALNDTSGLCRKLLDAAGKEIWTECAVAGPCRTGEAVVTRACALPARRLIHTVAPRFSVAYQSAAEHALHMCYRAVLSAAVEHQLATVAFPCVYTARKHYPRDEAAHVAARTVRRFLEHYRDEIACVVFCVDALEDQLTYEAVLPLYFPRNAGEEARSVRLLDGRALGDAFGEPVIEERKIRISELFTSRSENNEPEEDEHEDEDMAVQSFCQMSADPDVERLERLRRQQHAREQTTSKMVVKSRTTQPQDWSDLTKRRFLYNAGVDHSGAPVVVYMACRLSIDNDADLDFVLRFVVDFLDAIGEKSFSLLYVHSGDTATGSDESQLSAAWLKRLIKTIAAKYDPQLRFFYVYEPSMWLKLLLLVARGFVSGAFYKKIVYLASPRDLAHVASALDVPHYMDPKSVVPASDNNRSASPDAVEYATVFPRKPEAIL